MKRFLLSLALACGASEAVQAQQAAAPEGSQPLPQAIALDETGPREAENRISVSVGTDLVTEYISRGVLFAEEVSLQPYITVTVALPELEGGPITDASAFVGSWGSVKLGSIPPGPAGGLTRFYETDLYAGAAVELAERWTISATYYRYESLGDSFEGYNDFELIVGYDDSGAWDKIVPLNGFSLAPSLRLVQEAGRPGRKDALYVQPSITPSFDVAIGRRQVRIAIPLMIGLSDEYYDGLEGEKKTFGFFRTGLTASTQLAPEALRAVTINGGIDIWVPNDEVASGLDGFDVVGRVGIGWSF